MQTEPKQIFPAFDVCRYCGHENLYHDDVHYGCRKCIEIADIEHASHAFVGDGGWTWPLCDCGQPTRAERNDYGVLDGTVRSCRDGHRIEVDP